MNEQPRCPHCKQPREVHNATCTASACQEADYYANKFRNLTKRQANKIDKDVAAAFFRHCNGIPIPMLTITAISNAGRLAILKGESVDAAVIAAVAAVRCDQ